MKFSEDKLNQLVLFAEKRSYFANRERNLATAWDFLWYFLRAHDLTTDWLYEDGVNDAHISTALRALLKKLPA